MSKSRKNDLLLIQKDLANFNKTELNTLANFYSISTQLNKETLRKEIAKVNLQQWTKKQKARMPPIWPLPEDGPSQKSNEDLNKQALNTARQDCMQRLDKFKQDVVIIRDKHTKLFDALEKALQAEPTAFSQLLLKTCHNEVEEIATCISQALIHTEQTAEDIEQFLSELAPSEELVEKISLPSPPPSPQPTTKKLRGPSPLLEPRALFPTTGIFAEEEVELTPTPTEEEIELIPTPTEEEVELTPTPRLPELVQPVSVPAVLGKGAVQFVSTEKEIDDSPVPWFGPPSECESDEDCQEKQAAGSLSDLHPNQKVICVTKRDGSPDCAYQA